MDSKQGKGAVLGGWVQCSLCSTCRRVLHCKRVMHGDDPDFSPSLKAWASISPGELAG